MTPNVDELELTVNGERRTVAGGSTVAELVKQLELDARAVAVEHNGAILRRADYAERKLRSGDKLEVVRFVQGG